MSNTEQSNSYYDSWRFIEDYLPNYSSRNDVLRDDILLRYIEGDEVCNDDLRWIQEEFNNEKHLIKKELVRLESNFMAESLRAYYGI